MVAPTESDRWALDAGGCQCARRCGKLEIMKCTLLVALWLPLTVAAQAVVRFGVDADMPPTPAPMMAIAVVSLFVFTWPAGIFGDQLAGWIFIVMKIKADFDLHRECRDCDTDSMRV